MKIFWSWQSDTPGKTGRHFVRKALNEAIDLLREPQDVEEPDEAARREQLHVDAGREGVKGSPNLADKILEKIAASVCVVADVTPVGFGLPRKDESGKDLPPKALMNPNVAIEIGCPPSGGAGVINRGKATATAFSREAWTSRISACAKTPPPPPGPSGSKGSVVS